MSKYDGISVIEKFGTSDGSEFSSLSEAKKYNEILKVCDEVEGYLPSRPNDSDFTNGVGWIQHECNIKIELAKDIVNIYNDCFNSKATELSSRVGRHISDSEVKCLNHLMYRWQCMDSLSREFGQPYFVGKFEKIKGGRIN